MERFGTSVVFGFGLPAAAGATFFTAAVVVFVAVVSLAGALLAVVLVVVVLLVVVLLAVVFLVAVGLLVVFEALGDVFVAVFAPALAP